MEESGQFEPQWDLFDILAGSGAHGSLRIASLPNSAQGVTRLILIDQHDGQKLASFWLMNNVLVRFTTWPRAGKESFWVLTPYQLERCQAVIAGLETQYNQG